MRVLPPNLNANPQSPLTVVSARSSQVPSGDLASLECLLRSSLENLVGNLT